MIRRRMRARKFRSSVWQLLPLVRVQLPPHRALVKPSRFASRPSGFDPSRNDYRSSSPGALGKGARRHESCRRRYRCPVPGCPLNRSRRCTRSRVPPSASLCSRSCGCHFPLRRCAIGARLIRACCPRRSRPSPIKKWDVGRLADLPFSPLCACGEGQTELS